MNTESRFYLLIILIILLINYSLYKNNVSIEKFDIRYRPIHYSTAWNNYPNIVLPPTFNSYDNRFTFKYLYPYPYYYQYSYPTISLNSFCNLNPYLYPCSKWKYIY